MILLILPFILTSCLVTQYNRVGSNELVLNEKNDFVFENDTVRIVYRFNGIGGPLQITIENRGSQPLRVDWKKSALVAGGEAHAYYRPAANLNGNVETGNNGYGQISGQVTGEEALQFLPPDARITRRVGRIGELLEEPADFTGASWVKKGQGYSRLKYKELNFNENDSPLKFRSFITLISGPGEGREFTLDHSFYLMSNLKYRNGYMVPDPVKNGGNTFMD